MNIFEEIASLFSFLFHGKSNNKKDDNTNSSTDDTTTEKEETHLVEIIPFDDGEKEAIANILRPLIKSLNSNEIYIALCESLCQTKTLKTYTNLSEDKMTLTITLSQSKIFNNLIAEFINSHVVANFKASIDAEFLGKYDVQAADGSIVIHKLA